MLNLPLGNLGPVVIPFLSLGLNILAKDMLPKEFSDQRTRFHLIDILECWELKLLPFLSPSSFGKCSCWLVEKVEFYFLSHLALQPKSQLKPDKDCKMDQGFSTLLSTFSLAAGILIRGLLLLVDHAIYTGAS